MHSLKLTMSITSALENPAINARLRLQRKSHFSVFFEEKTIVLTFGQHYLLILRLISPLSPADWEGKGFSFLKKKLS